MSLVSPKRNLPGILIVVLLLFGFHAKSIEQTYHRKISGLGLEQGVQLPISDPLPDEGTQVAYEIVVELSYGKEFHTDVEGSLPWDAHVQFLLSYQEGDGQFVSHNEENLNIDFNQNDHPKIIDYKRFSISGGEANVEITLVEGDFPEDVQLKVYLVKKFDGITEQSHHGILGYNAEGQFLYWTYMPHASEYEVGWVFKDAFDQGSQYAEPTNVVVRDTYLPWYPTFGEGEVFFSFRPVYSRNGGKLYGDLIVSSTVLTIDETMAFERDKSWRTSLAYVEDGHFDQAISYTDGLGKVRQTAVDYQGHEVTLVKEQKLDHEGRSVIEIMPTPVNHLASENPFSFQKNLNLFEGDQDKLNYDQGEGAPLLDNSSGASKYYSSNNDFEMFNKDYLADAEGYPFVQYEFSRDGRGRINRLSNVGAELRLHNGGDSGPKHFSRFLYGTPNKVELHRLFGSNVGKASFYRKNAIIDPNGQISVSYLDQYNRTIATALAGEVPDNLNQILSYPETPIDLGTPLITNDGPGEGLVRTSTNKVLNLVAGTGYVFNYSLDGVINQFDPCFQLQNSMLSDLSPVGSLYNEDFFDHIDLAGISLTDVGPASSELILDPAAFNPVWASELIEIHPQYDELQQCIANTNYPICSECVYDLEINFFKPDGLEMTYENSEGIITPYKVVKTFSASGVVDLCGQTTYSESITPVSLTFDEVGEYTITKTLKLSDGAIDALVTRLKAEQPDGFPNLDQLILEYKEKIDYSDCGTDCEQTCYYEVLATGDYEEGSESFELAVAACHEGVCGDNGGLSDDFDFGCDNLLAAMHRQISQGGVYHNQTFLSGYESDIEQLTIPGIDVSSGAAKISKILDPNDWQDVWVEYLIPRNPQSSSIGIHPEYHHYKACYLETAAKSFANELVGIKDWDEANFTGYIDPIGSFSGRSILDVNPQQIVYDRIIDVVDQNEIANRLEHYFDETTIEVDGITTGFDYNADGVISPISLWEFVSSPNSFGGEVPTSEEKWQMFAGAYLDIRRDLRGNWVNDLSGSNPLYLVNASGEGTENTLVYPPQTIPQDVDQITNVWMQDQLNVQCAETCKIQAQIWTNSLLGNCGIDVSESTKVDITSHFQNYCDNHCGYDNPLNILAREDIGSDPDLEVISGILNSIPEKDDGCLYEIATSRSASYIENCDVTFEVKSGDVSYLELYEDVLNEFEQLVESNPGQSVYYIYPGDPAFDNLINKFGVNGENWFLSSDSWSEGERLEYYPNGHHFPLNLKKGSTQHALISRHGWRDHPNRTLYQYPDFNVQDFDRIESICTYDASIPYQGRGVLTMVLEDGTKSQYEYRFNDQGIPVASGCISKEVICEISVNTACGCMGDVFEGLSELNANSLTGTNYTSDLKYKWDYLPERTSQFAEIANLINESFETYRNNGLSGSQVINDFMPDFESRARDIGWTWYRGSANKPYPLHFAHIHSSLGLWISLGDQLTASTFNACRKGDWSTLSTNEFIRIIRFYDEEGVIPPTGSDFYYQRAQIETTSGIEDAYFVIYNPMDALPSTGCPKSNIVRVENQDSFLKVYNSTGSFNVTMYDKNGTRIVFNEPGNEVVSIGNVSYLRNSPVQFFVTPTPPDGGSSLPVFANFQVLVERTSGDVTEVIKAYVYVDDEEDVFDPFFNTCIMEPELVKDPDEVFTVCADLKEKEAVLLATMEYEKELTKYISEYLNESVDNCLKRPYRERFSYSSNMKEHHYTLFYYDQAGNLVQTVPPEGVRPISIDMNTDFDEDCNYIGSNEPEHGLLTKYHYNSLNQLVWQQTPDAGEEWFWYDADLRLRLSQNARQAQHDQFTYIRYDNQSRVVETGQLDNLGRSLEELNDEELFETVIQPYISDPSWPQLNEQNDSYNFTEIVKSFYDSPSSSAQVSMPLNNTRDKLVQIIYQDDIGDSENNYFAFSYDQQGTVESVQQSVPGLGNKIIRFEYEVLSGKLKQLMYQQGAGDQLVHRYRYNEDNRLAKVETSDNGWLWQNDFQQYYAPHGELIREELGDEKVQGLDYITSIQGWIKGVNLPHIASGNRSLLDPGNDGIGLGSSQYVGQDEFAYTLGFFEGDYSPIGTVDLGAGGTSSLFHSMGDGENGLLGNGMYNGNITTKVIHTKGLGYKQGLQGIEADQKGINMMQFQYDQLNRLTHANSFHAFNGVSWSSTKINENNARFTYDANGNMTRLIRHNQGHLMDDMTYDYAKSQSLENMLLNNQVTAVSEPIGLDLAEINDFVGQGTDNYSYDDMGNMTSDNSEEIESIEWTMRGKIKRITRSPGSAKSDLEFVYNPFGHRIAKISKPQGSHDESEWSRTFYTTDVDGNVMGNYSRKQGSGIGEWELILTEQPIYGAKRIGIIQQSKTIGVANSAFLDDINYFNELSGDMVGLSFGDSPLFVEDPLAQGSGNLVMQIPESNTPVSYESVLKLRVGDRIGIRFEYMKDGGTVSKVDGKIDLTYYDHNGDVLWVDRKSPSFGSWLEWRQSFFGTRIGNFLPSSLKEQDIDYVDVVFVFPKSDGYYFRDLEISVDREEYRDPYSSISSINTGGGLFQGTRFYELSDNLGSVHAVVSDLKTGIDDDFDGEANYYSAHVASLSAYYPFGMEIPGYTYSDNFRYGFNGKEKESELKDGYSLDFGARIYDSRVARFLSLDPRMHEFPYMSPYCFAGNDPIAFIDENGEGPDDKTMYTDYDVPVTGVPDHHRLSDVEKAAFELSLHNNHPEIPSKKYYHYINERQTQLKEAMRASDEHGSEIQREDDFNKWKVKRREEQYERKHDRDSYWAGQEKLAREALEKELRSRYKVHLKVVKYTLIGSTVVLTVVFPPAAAITSAGVTYVSALEDYDEAASTDGDYFEANAKLAFGVLTLSAGPLIAKLPKAAQVAIEAVQGTVDVIEDISKVNNSESASEPSSQESTKPESKKSTSNTDKKKHPGGGPVKTNKLKIKPSTGSPSDKKWKNWYK